ncbi:hypothetical protein AB0D97_14135 [Streptomyces roseus]|uniref:hypothetical protein n=1 Tax=Streptomyces roseus TaxID=66430 RepID=UPI00340158C8
MSARNVLIEHVMSLQATICGEFCGGCSCEVGNREEANALVNAFAHELAEKVRTSSYYSHVPTWGYSHQRDAWNDGRDVAADLIEPAADRCVGCGEPSDNGQGHGHGAEYGGCV